LVNEAEAHRSGGKFVVRIDDTHPYWCHLISKGRRDQYYEEYQEQLNPFVKVDAWQRQSWMPTLQEIIGNNPFLENLRPPIWGDTVTIEWKTDESQKIQQCDRHLTMQRVIWDFYEGINLLIRGDDLITEAHFYEYWGSELQLPKIRQIYIPRLMAQNQKDEIRDTVSKSGGKFVLGTQIDKFGIEETMYWLRLSCLIDVDEGFFVENIKWNPVVKGLID